MTDQERIAELEAENAQLREHLAVLLGRMRDLEACLAKDSHNSGKPPSSDGLKRQLPAPAACAARAARNPADNWGISARRCIW